MDCFFQKPHEITTYDLYNLFFTVSAGQQLRRKFYTLAISFDAIIVKVGARFSEIPHLIVKVKAKPYMFYPYKVSNMVNMVSEIFFIEKFFFGVSNKGTAHIHPQNASAGSKPLYKGIRKIAHGESEISAI